MGQGRLGPADLAVEPAEVVLAVRQVRELNVVARLLLGQALTQRQRLLVGLAGLVEPAEINLDVTQTVVDLGQVTAVETVTVCAGDRLEDVNGLLVRLQARCPPSRTRR